MRREKTNNRTRPLTFLKVRKSLVHGRGVFATKAIRKGARIIEYTGRRVSWESIPAESDELRTYYFGLDNGKDVIDPAVGGNEARWINHSCDPNCEAIEDEKGRVFIHALRDLHPGEELFYDYCLAVDVVRTKEIEEEAKCFCATSRCRGTMLAQSQNNNCTPP
jgi:SET domain-containing protein